MFHKIAILTFWLLIWELVNRIVDNSVLMAGPIATMGALFSMAQTMSFYASILGSLGRVFAGFSLAFFVGILMASFSSFRPFYMLIVPLCNVIKSIPVASFVIIALIWVGSQNLAVFVSFITVFPIVFFNAYNGIKSTDAELLEMADFFQVGLIKKIRYVYYRAVLPHLVSAVATGFGFAWKSGIAAELIGLTRESIGFHLHTARVFLMTAELFAWTLTVVVLSYLIERVFMLIFRGVED